MDISRQQMEGSSFDMDREYENLAFSFHGDSNNRITGLEGSKRDSRNIRGSLEGYDPRNNALMGRAWDMGRRAEHKGMVCSRCCVERGTEGEVWCLRCLRAEEGG